MGRLAFTRTTRSSFQRPVLLCAALAWDSCYRSTLLPNGHNSEAAASIPLELNSPCHVSPRWASGARATLFLMILSLSSPSLDPNSQDAALQCGCACHYVRQRIRLSSLCKPFNQRFALDGPIVANMCSLVNQHHCFSASHIISDSDTVLEREPRQPSGPLRDIVTTAKS